MPPQPNKPSPSGDTTPYLTPAGFGEAEFVEKRSRFIARVWPAADEAEALAHIGTTRRRHPDANHNVYAYIIRSGPTRYSDDGEPQGTSGIPTLNIFKSGGIFNVCCVVTRYFGGVLLGAGGLVRAYSAAAKAALAQAGIQEMRLWEALLIPCPYPLYQQMQYLLAIEGGVIQSAEYGVEVMLEALLPVERTPAFLRALSELGSGRIEAAVMEKVFRGGPPRGTTTAADGG